MKIFALTILFSFIIKFRFPKDKPTTTINIVMNLSRRSLISRPSVCQRRDVLRLRAGRGHGGSVPRGRQPPGKEVLLELQQHCRHRARALGGLHGDCVLPVKP